MKKAKFVRRFLAGALAAMMIVALVFPAGAASLIKTIEVFTGVKIYVDGVKLDPKDANGKAVDVFIYNGTTYVPLRAVSENLGENVQWDGSTRTVYIGDDPRINTYLIEVCPPYESYGYSAPGTFKMGGKTYANGFTLYSTSENYALFNLNGRYSSFEFDMGHIDGGYMKDGAYNIYLDGQYSETIELSAEAPVTHFEIDLNYATQVKIVGSSTHLLGVRYGFANAILH